MLEPFQTTIWTSIRQAKEGRSAALEDFAAKYREPVVSFLKHLGYTREDAEDLSQEAFLLIFRDGLLLRAEAAKGRFRSFLLGVVKNVTRNADRILMAVKRGGRRRGFSLEDPIGDDASLADVLASPVQDDAFDREWVHHLVHLVLDQLARRNPRHHRVLELQVEEELSCADIAGRLGMEQRQVENLHQQARFKFAELLRAEIATYCSSREEFDEEMNCLGRYLAG